MTQQISKCLFFLCVLPAAALSFRIASFNVQIFGRNKVKNVEVVDALVQIIRRYDIILIQEIRDSSGLAITELLEALNKNTKSSNKYLLVISSPLGRTNSKEQYAYIYRDSSHLKLIDKYQYADPKDVFEREPFAVRFQSTKTVPTDFVLVGCHTDPDTAVQEINSLADVHDAVQKHWKTDNILMMGDLNAGCSYASKSRLKEVNTRNDPKFVWYIADDADTTTKSTHCAYDRFIASGYQLISGIVPNSAKVYPFDVQLGLTENATQAVSDHYPIELELKSSAHKNEAMFLPTHVISELQCTELLHRFLGALLFLLFHWSLKS